MGALITPCALLTEKSAGLPCKEYAPPVSAEAHPLEMVRLNVSWAYTVGPDGVGVGVGASVGVGVGPCAAVTWTFSENSDVSPCASVAVDVINMPSDTPLTAT